MAINLPARSKLRLNRMKVFLYRHIGCSFQSIGEEIGVSSRSVSEYIKQNPITPEEEIKVHEMASALINSDESSHAHEQVASATNQQRSMKRVKTTSDMQDKHKRQQDLINLMNDEEN